MGNAGRCPDLPEALPLDSAKGAQPLWKPILFQNGPLYLLQRPILYPYIYHPAFAGTALANHFFRK